MRVASFRPSQRPSGTTGITVRTCSRAYTEQGRDARTHDAHHPRKGRKGMAKAMAKGEVNHPASSANLSPRRSGALEIPSSGLKKKTATATSSASGIIRGTATEGQHADTFTPAISRDAARTTHAMRTTRLSHDGRQCPIICIQRIHRNRQAGSHSQMILPPIKQQLGCRRQAVEIPQSHTNIT